MRANGAVKMTDVYWNLNRGCFLLRFPGHPVFHANRKPPNSNTSHGSFAGHALPERNPPMRFVAPPQQAPQRRLFAPPSLGPAAPPPRRTMAATNKYLA